MAIDFPNSPTNGDLFSAGGKNWQYNGTAWVLQGIVPYVRLLDDVGDVTITSATSGDFLKWNGSAWINDTIPNGSITETQIADSAITSDKIADGAVTAAKLGPGIGGGLDTEAEGAISIMDIGS